jgi:small-conductance mechanosensitive channel
MRIALYLLACFVGLVLALLGEEPLIALALAAVILYPLGVSFVMGGERDQSRPVPLGASLLAGAAGAFLAVFLIRLAVAAPDWVDPLSADCGGPSTGAQQLVTWFATVAFLLSSLPVLVTLAAIAGRLRTGPLASLPLSLGLYPFAVALSGIALILASWATSC